MFFFQFPQAVHLAQLVPESSHIRVFHAVNIESAQLDTGGGFA
jgi:hypothetical protein